MRKLFLILATVISFVSCVKENGPSGSAENPLNECLCPATVRAGGEGIIQWNGFTEGDALALVTDSAVEYPLEAKVVTASGLIFTVPSDVPAGEYQLVLLGDVRKELGRIMVLELLCPVSGVDIPAQAIIGETVDITGLGFEEGCTIVMVDDGGVEYALVPQLTYSGVSMVIPDDMPEGIYSVYLLQGGVRWVLSSSFEVCKDIVIKKYRQIRYFYPYSGDDMIMMSWNVSQEEPVTLTVSEYLVSEGEITLNAYDSYVADGDDRFVLSYDGLEISNAVEMSYQLDASGSVASSDVRFYGKKTSTAVGWTYDADGYLTSIYSPTMVLRSMEYEDGNLTVFRQTRFKYDDPALVNSPYAPDVVWGYMSLQEYMDPYVYVPYLMGWYTRASRQLPTSFFTPSPTGAGEVEHAVEYEFDEDGYVIKMSWAEGSSSYWVEYLYE